MTPQFKADNLVINETRDSIYKLQFEDNDIELWQPKVGEWCWYKHLLVKVISVDKRDDGIIRYVVSAPMYAEQYSGAISLEPFIGTLPSICKNKQ